MNIGAQIETRGITNDSTLPQKESLFHGKRQSNFDFLFNYKKFELMKFLQRNLIDYSSFGEEKRKQILLDFIQAGYLLFLKQVELIELFEIIGINKDPDKDPFIAHIQPLIEKWLKSKKCFECDSQNSVKLFFSLVGLIQSVQSGVEEYWNLELLQIVKDNFNFFAISTETLN